jgi:hypothetical protein
MAADTASAAGLVGANGAGLASDPELAGFP